MWKRRRPGERCCFPPKKVRETHRKRRAALGYKRTSRCVSSFYFTGARMHKLPNPQRDVRAAGRIYVRKMCAVRLVGISIMLYTVEWPVSTFGVTRPDTRERAAPGEDRHVRTRLALGASRLARGRACQRVVREIRDLRGPMLPSVGSSGQRWVSASQRILGLVQLSSAALSGLPLELPQMLHGWAFSEGSAMTAAEANSAAVASCRAEAGTCRPIDAEHRPRDILSSKKKRGRAPLILGCHGSCEMTSGAHERNQCTRPPPPRLA